MCNKLEGEKTWQVAWTTASMTKVSKHALHCAIDTEMREFRNILLLVIKRESFRTTANARPVGWYLIQQLCNGLYKFAPGKGDSDCVVILNWYYSSHVLTKCYSIYSWYMWSEITFDKKLNSHCISYDFQAAAEDSPKFRPPITVQNLDNFLRQIKTRREM